MSRGFHEAFGVTPVLFRLEARTRRAWRALAGSERSLTAIAHEQGFADRAHMSRSGCESRDTRVNSWSQPSSGAVRSGDEARAALEGQILPCP